MAKKKAVTKSSVDEELKDILSYKKEPVGFEKIKFKLKCKNPKQKEYSKLIRENNITICTGPSGVGKSYIALATALELLSNPDTPYKKLVLMIAPVQTDIEVGFLKGELDSKLRPHAEAYLYNLADMIGGMDKVEALIEGGFIEIMCVSFARGINLKDCVCICGECQQYSKESFLTIITRPTETAKLCFEGDQYQTDNKNIRKGREESGLKHALENLSNLPGIGILEFDASHIVRNPLISKILYRWDKDTYGYLEEIIKEDDLLE